MRSTEFKQQSSNVGIVLEAHFCPWEKHECINSPLVRSWIDLLWLQPMKGRENSDINCGEANGKPLHSFRKKERHDNSQIRKKEFFKRRAMVTFKIFDWIQVSKCKNYLKNLLLTEDIVTFWFKFCNKNLMFKF